MPCGPGHRPLHCFSSCMSLNEPKPVQLLTSLHINSEKDFYLAAVKSSESQLLI